MQVSELEGWHIGFRAGVASGRLRCAAHGPESRRRAREIVEPAVDTAGERGMTSKSALVGNDTSPTHGPAIRAEHEKRPVAGSIMRQVVGLTCAI